MKIFLSHPSTQRDTAASINYELHNGGHEVFFDKEDLPPGQSYNEKIRAAIGDADLFIFLITPQSVTQGHYTLTELKLASTKWPSPASHVLPVMVESTPLDKIPAYLKAVTILTPEGNLTAEVLMAVAELASASPAKAKINDDADSATIESFSYQPVEIRFGAGSAGSYAVAITASPAGNIAAQPCALDAEGWASDLWADGVTIAGVARRGNIDLGPAAAELLPSEAAARRIGEKLYHALFNAQLQAPLHDSLRSVDPQRRAGLRFLINTTEAPDLARLPWEFLYDPTQEDFLFSDRMKPVIRWLDVDQPPPMLAIEPPLRLLMVIASPQDRPELSVGAELAHLDDALRDMVDQGRITTTRLEHATLEKLDDALLTHKPHMLHFIGHGDFVGSDGVIVLETESTGNADPITGRRLGVLLRNHLGSLRFVFLNSCLGAAVSRRDPFGGVAQNLIRRGIPAVIAMQFPVADAVAVILARHFYRYLAAGMPVDTALTSARAFLFARGYPVEWGAPALHMRTPDGKIFAVGAPSQPAATMVKTTPPSPPPAAKMLPPQGQPKAAAPSRRWLWALTALLVVMSAIAGVLLLQRAPHSTLPIGTAPPPQPDGIPTGPTPTVPQTTATQHYQAALQALHSGNPEAARRSLEEARRLDPDGAALTQSPETRQALFDELLNKARKDLAAGNIDAARDSAESMLQVDKERAAVELKKLFPTGDRETASAGRSYRVQIGDSLWSIAAKRYGEPRQWPQIYQANQARIANPNLIFPNQELVIPAPSQQAEPQRYSVKSGDTLWQIAGSIYGDPTLWRQVYEANRGHIKNPDTIFTGQELLLPIPATRHPSRQQSENR